MRITGPLITKRQVDDFIVVIKSIDLSNRRKSYYRAKSIEILNSVSLPLPSETFLNYSSVSTLSLVTRGVHQYLLEDNYMTLKQRDAVSEAIKNSPLPSYRYDTNSYRLRTFGSDGQYPSANFERADAKYKVINGVPFLFTKNNYQAEERSIGGGVENTVLSRREVKMLSSLMCVNGLIATFSLRDSMSNSNVLNIPEEYLSDVKDGEIVEFMIEYWCIVRGGPPNSKGVFNFTPSDWAEREISLFYRNFRVSDLLLLRTCFLLIKASSMVENRNYFEDAISSIFVGLEGVMMIMQRDDGEPYGGIRRAYQKAKFESLFNDNGQTYDFVMEEVFAYGEKRAALVHPQAGTDWGWVPPVVGEDYYDYRQILRSLLYNSVTGSFYDPYQYR